MAAKHTDIVEQVDRVDTTTFESGEKTMAIRGVDDALVYAIESEQLTWTPEEERRLLWKIDLRLIPLVRNPSERKHEYLLILYYLADGRCVLVAI